jgi:hypothetical protein
MSVLLAVLARTPDPKAEPEEEELSLQDRQILERFSEREGDASGKSEAGDGALGRGEPPRSNA